MKEIGSEFWDIPISDKDNGIFPQNTKWFLSGRSALRAIIRDLKNIKTIAIPSWCCESMVKPFEEVGIEVNYYPVYWNKILMQDIKMDSDALLIMDYFGYTGPMPYLSDYKGIVIRDVTHSIFSKEYSDADYYFGSLRKWCGFWTGGYAWGHGVEAAKETDEEYVYYRRIAMEDKAKYILYGGTKDYLQLFDKAEERLEKVGICAADTRDVYAARHLDVELIREKRRKNAEILIEAFPDLLIFPSLSPADCPMFVPIIVFDGKRDALRQFLIDQSIYSPIHWPNSDLGELSLICDQRYSELDMMYLVNKIKQFWQEA